MALHEIAILGIFLLSMGCVAAVFAGYPAALFFLSHMGSAQKTANPARKIRQKTVSMLVIFRDAQALIQKKIENFHHLDYPEELLEMVLVSDGTTDQSRQMAQAFQGARIRFYHFDDHQGKITCLNFGITQCRGEIVVFSDVDAILDTGAVKTLCRHFSDSAVGGVCGRRILAQSRSKIRSGQMKFVQWDTLIKQLEMANNLSVTSHDGKLYAIQKTLYTQIPQGVTDDAFLSLSVVKQGTRFVFDPEAVAVIPVPSYGTRHELLRRRRIVSASLNGLWIHRALFDGKKYGFFAVGLFINKVVRRALPVFLILMLLSSFFLSDRPLMAVLFWCQAAGYLFFLSFPLGLARLPDRPAWCRFLKKAGSTGYFFCVGMAGTLLGIISFLSGEKISKWDPVKK